jgi:type III secretion protein U
VSDKTEDPTPKRLRKAAQDGDSAASPALSQAVSLVAMVVLLPSLAMSTAVAFRDDLLRALRASATTPPVEALGAGLLSVGPQVLRGCLPALVCVAVAAGITTMAQTKAQLATGRVGFRADALDWIRGAKQLLSLQRSAQVLRGLVFAAVLAVAAYAAGKDALRTLPYALGGARSALDLGAGLALRLLRMAAFIGLVLGLADVGIARIAFLRRVRMSKDEVKREAKESEGNPELKAARDRAHHEMLAYATTAQVAKATVVVVNPTHIAAALRYDEEGGDDAPVLLASGRGDLAARIIEAARIHGVPIVRDVPLARLLVELPLGEPIPESLYEVVAEILRLIYEEDSKSAR